MKRREAIQSVGATLALGSVASTVFARSGEIPADFVEGAAGQFGWLARRPLRLELDSIRISDDSPAFDIDAIFDIAGQRIPHRIVSHRPGAVSPASQLFGFRLNPDSFVGFEMVQTATGDRCNVTLAAGCSRALSVAYRRQAGESFVLQLDAKRGQAELRPLGASKSVIESTAGQHQTAMAVGAGAELHFRIHADRV